MKKQVLQEKVDELGRVVIPVRVYIDLEEANFI